MFLRELFLDPKPDCRVFSNRPHAVTTGLHPIRVNPRHVKFSSLHLGDLQEVVLVTGLRLTAWGLSFPQHDSEKSIAEAKLRPVWTAAVRQVLPCPPTPLPPQIWDVLSPLSQGC